MMPLPPLPAVADIQERLQTIFPWWRTEPLGGACEGSHDRGNIEIAYAYESHAGFCCAPDFQRDDFS